MLTKREIEIDSVISNLLIDKERNKKLLKSNLNKRV